jgi:hypothetical protein
MDKTTDTAELTTAVLGITRDQLSRSMNLCAELEGLLTLERKKYAELEARLVAANTKIEELSTPKSKD